MVLTFAMALVVQEMTVRLGAATHRGHAELIFERFGPFWGWFSMIDLGIGNFLTLITEFIAIRAGLGFFGVPPWAAILVALTVLFSALLSHRYWTWERVTLAAAAFNLIFIPVALMAHPHWGAVGHAFFTWKPLPGFNRDTVLIVLSDIGATVTPWMLFFQQSATVDKGLTTKDIHYGRIDTVLGAATGGGGGAGSDCGDGSVVRTHQRGEFRSGPVCAGAGAGDRSIRRGAVCAGHGGSGHRGLDYDFDVVGVCIWRSGAGGRTV